jgi:hypothetical protein
MGVLTAYVSWQVLDATHDDWWLVRTGAAEGHVPSNRVAPIKVRESVLIETASSISHVCVDPPLGSI